jgi:hypothetical protein
MTIRPETINAIPIHRSMDICSPNKYIENTNTSGKLRLMNGYACPRLSFERANSQETIDTSEKSKPPST